MDARKAHDKIHGDVSPDGGWEVQLLEQAARMKMLHLVALSGCARLDEVQQCPARVGNVEVCKNHPRHHQPQRQEHMGTKKNTQEPRRMSLKLCPSIRN
jgi:hypothetical protein